MKGQAAQAKSCILLTFLCICLYLGTESEKMRWNKKMMRAKMSDARKQYVNDLITIQYSSSTWSGAWMWVAVFR